MTVSRVALTLTTLLLLSGCAHHMGGHKMMAPEGMVLIPAGPFIMGTDKSDAEANEAEELGLPYTWYSDATPQRTIDLPAFYIDKYEMTNAQYLVFLNETELPIDPPFAWNGPTPPDGTGDLPVTGLNWYEAFLSCQSFGKRLPSEAEWEKAARGPDGNLYPWGNEFDETKANVAHGAKGRLMPVGSYPEGASVYGVEDLIGNAWEWTKSWYGPYPETKYMSDNYGKRFKAIRGNSYAEPGHFDKEARRRVIGQMSRGNYRFSFDPKGRFRDSGARCAKSLPGDDSK